MESKGKPIDKTKGTDLVVSKRLEQEGRGETATATFELFRPSTNTTSWRSFTIQLLYVPPQEGSTDMIMF